MESYREGFATRHPNYLNHSKNFKICDNCVFWGDCCYDNEDDMCTIILPRNRTYVVMSELSSSAFVIYAFFNMENVLENEDYPSNRLMMSHSQILNTTQLSHDEVENSIAELIDNNLLIQKPVDVIGSGDNNGFQRFEYYLNWQTYAGEKIR